MIGEWHRKVKRRKPSLTGAGIRGALLQLFNLLDRQIAALRCDPCVTPPSEGQLVRTENNRFAQSFEMSFMAVPVRAGLRDLIRRHPVHVGRPIEFHPLPSVKCCLDTSSPFGSIEGTKQDVQLIRKGLLRTVERALWGPPKKSRLL